MHHSTYSGTVTTNSRNEYYALNLVFCKFCCFFFPLIHKMRKNEDLLKPPIYSSRKKKKKRIKILAHSTLVAVRQ